MIVWVAMLKATQRLLLGSEFSIVINGRRVIKGDADYQAIKQAVQEELILSEA